MNLKIVSKDSENIVNLSNLSQNLKVNSEIYTLKEDKEILLGLVSHSLLVYFCVEFADYALQNYTNEKIPKAEECISLVRKWIENPNSVSKEELNDAANAANAAAYAAYAAAAADAAADAAYAAYAAAYAADAAADAAAYAYAAAYAADAADAYAYADAAAYAADAADAAGKNKEKEFERQGEFIFNYLSSNAWLFNL